MFDTNLYGHQNCAPANLKVMRRPRHDAVDPRAKRAVLLRPAPPSRIMSQGSGEAWEIYQTSHIKYYFAFLVRSLIRFWESESTL